MPPSYDLKLQKRYPVLYLHDGQNVFSSAGADCCFGWGSWELDRTADQLITAGRMEEIIMVAIDNSRWRYQEDPGPTPGQTGNDTLAAAQHDRFQSYSWFLRKELKPMIDRDYRTLPQAGHTGVMGSSLGGICSVALAWQNPRTFGAAASLSGSFQIEKKSFLEKVLRPFRGRRKPVRFYLDSGIIDFTGDDDGRKNTEAVVQELKRIGWRDGENLKHFVAQPLSDAELEQAGLRRDKRAEARISQHNEFYWRHRAWRALAFLFPPP